MTTLIERLLEWLAALGAPVIVLSATLPSSRRASLLAAYARGARWTAQPPMDAPLLHADYPRISYLAERERGELHVPADATRALTLTLDWVDGVIPQTPAEPFPLDDHLSELLFQGGCCAVICNTVRRAQAVYTALKHRFPGLASDGEPLVDLFHARFLLADRDKREQRTLLRFSATGDEHRPKTAMLVATQVVEQSLDLDFDLLVTDLAPVDLILQRAGRLHRRQRKRPAPLETPRLLICRPVRFRDDDVPAFDGGSEAVYERHILLNTWLTLRDRRTLQLPADIAPLVESVYEEDVLPAGSSTALRAAWESSSEAMRKNQANDAREAENRYIKRPWSDVDLSEIAIRPREEDSPELHPKLQALTRLTELTAQVICLSGSAERAQIGPDGPTAPLSAKPSVEQTITLLGRSVQLSNPYVVHALLATEPPRGWQETAALRHARALFFDASHTAHVGNARIHLDPELGVVIETPRNHGGSA